MQELEELQEKSRQLLDIERLAALGKIADRVAHELRNPLTESGCSRANSARNTSVVWLASMTVSSATTVAPLNRPVKSVVVARSVLN